MLKKVPGRKMDVGAEAPFYLICFIAPEGRRRALGPFKLDQRLLPRRERPGRLRLLAGTVQSPEHLRFCVPRPPIDVVVDGPLVDMWATPAGASADERCGRQLSQVLGRNVTVVVKDESRHREVVAIEIMPRRADDLSHLRAI